MIALGFLLLFLLVIALPFAIFAMLALAMVGLAVLTMAAMLAVVFAFVGALLRPTPPRR